MANLCFWLLCFAAALFVGLVPGSHAQTQATDDPRFTPPPGEETSEIKKLINRAQASLTGGGVDISGLLTDPSYMSAHEWPRFRALIRDNATAGQTTIVTSQEPGEAMVVSGTLRNTSGTPIPNALIYVYQTSAKGWYSDKAPHISAIAGDEKHARLFGYFRTNKQGEYEFRTIRPGGYPRSTLPAHIHIEIEIPKPDSRVFISEIQFADDPRLTKELRERSSRERLFIFPVKREGNVQRVQADFEI